MASLPATPQTARYSLTWDEVKALSIPLMREGAAYGIPRGGQYASGILAGLGQKVTHDVHGAEWLVDDIIDTGTTATRWQSATGLEVRALIDRRNIHNNPQRVEQMRVIGPEAYQKGWIVFPWEVTEEEAPATDNVLRVLQAIGEDPTREGLVETPARYMKFLREVCTPEPINFKTFQSDDYDQMIVQTGIPFYSLCEHHLVPFFGTIAIGYIPSLRIVGLSKLARAAEQCARGLNTQERITRRIATMIEEKLLTRGVGVIVKARHLCMEMRGVEKPGAETTTSCMLGKFRHDLNVRNEFLHLVDRQ